MLHINKHYKTIKTALRKHPLVDTFCLGKYGFSPYQGCGHACKYCDGRAEKYYVEGDFEKDIVIRQNLPDQLAADLKKLCEPGIIAIGSGVSDVYQPIEKDENLMRQCAEILAESHFPVHILTKSSLILRDLDLWKKVNAKNGFVLAISLTFLDDQLRQIFEPDASSVSERLQTIETFKKNGIAVGVLAMPFIPYISDNFVSIRTLFTKLKEMKVDFIIPGGLTLRPGRQKTLFLETIQLHFPDVVPQIATLYAEDRASGNCVYSYRKKFYPELNKLIEEFSIPCPLPHFIFQHKLALYDEIYILLNHLQELYARKNINTSRLQKSIQLYTTWLLDEKKYFNRHRKIAYQSLEEKLKQLIIAGKLGQIIENKKLNEFLKSVVIEDQVFDYRQLKLV
ncbi:radical SAM protein [candidate division KSB1 bacterium]|nr:radical SAM protein [candidate division KSB1 bacterium]